MLQEKKQTAIKRPLAAVHASSTGPGRRRCSVANFVGDGARSLSYPGPRPGAIQNTQNDRRLQVAVYLQQYSSISLELKGGLFSQCTEQ
jgi:hypothetical protein